MKAPSDTPTGDELYAEIEAAASRAGITVRKFASVLFRGEPRKVQQLRMAKRPLPTTVARVRALVAAAPLPPGRALLPRSPSCGRMGKASGDAHVPSELIIARRDLAERAHAERLPGETLHAATRRLSRQDETIASLGGGQ